MKVSRLTPKPLVLLGLVGLLLVPLACSGGGQQGGSAEGAEFNRPVDMIVPFGPGGGSDQMSRLVASTMEKELEIQIPVTNTEGASGSTGITNMLSRPPGTAMASFTQDMLATVAFGSAAYELEDLQAVCRTQNMPSGIFVTSDSRYENWKELAKAVRQNPNEVKIATAAEASAESVILGALAEQGIEFREVTYADPGERYTAVLGGAVDALYEQPGDLLQQLESGQFKPVLIFAKEPPEGLKGDYVVSEGVGLDVPILNQFRGIVTSADTDPETVKAMSGACAAIRKNQKWRKFQNDNFSLENSYMTSQEVQAYMNAQLKELEDLMEQQGITN